MHQCDYTKLGELHLARINPFSIYKLYGQFQASHNQEFDQHILVVATLYAERLILHQVDKPANCFVLPMSRPIGWYQV